MSSDARQQLPKRSVPQPSTHSFRQCLQAHSKHLLQTEQHPPYAPSLLGLAPLPAPHPSEPPAALHSLQHNTPASTPDHPAAPSHAVQQAAQGSASGGSSSLQAVGSPPAACGSPATAAGLAASQASAEAKPPDGSQPSNSAIALTRTSAGLTGEDALSRAPASELGTSLSGTNGQTSVHPAQAQGDSTDMGHTASTQQKGGDGVEKQQQGGVTDTGGAPHSGSPLSGGQSGRGWRPTIELPVCSITEVASLCLLPEFLHDIGQVSMTTSSLWLMLVAPQQHDEGCMLRLASTSCDSDMRLHSGADA